ncbi:MAG TPA: phosphotransferase family protein [Vicinamibacterales bacterium]|nr:phosphotransferase family protein [Vicinamibacterales bacterium]
MYDTSPVRASEQLDWPRLEAYLRAQLPGRVESLDASAPMAVEQFPGGHSNLTYLIRFGDMELVLRRPPFGPVPASAHDMAREYRWLAALNPIFPLAPRPFLLCDDAGIAGATFYVMERRHGRVLRDEEPPEVLDQPDVRRLVSERLIDTLADLHSIDITREDIAGLGKPRGFVERQVRGWTERWTRSKIDTVAEMDDCAQWLVDHLPPEPDRCAVVHGDFKLDNIMLATDRIDRLVAVFDWEMTALGDPLIDVGILLAYWSATVAHGGHAAPAPLTTRPGWFSRDQVVERYATRSGRDVSHMRFYEIFALFKVAVIVQQIFYRYTHGQTDDPRFARFDVRVASLARRASGLIDRAG